MLLSYQMFYAGLEPTYFKLKLLKEILSSKSNFHLKVDKRECEWHELWEDKSGGIFKGRKNKMMFKLKKKLFSLLNSIQKFLLYSALLICNAHIYLPRILPKTLTHRDTKAYQNTNIMYRIYRDVRVYVVKFIHFSYF